MTGHESVRALSDRAPRKTDLERATAALWDIGMAVEAPAGVVLANVEVIRDCALARISEAADLRHQLEQCRAALRACREGGTP